MKTDSHIQVTKGTADSKRRPTIIARKSMNFENNQIWVCILLPITHEL